VIGSWAESVAEAGLDVAPVLAMRDLGYMLMDETEHPFSLTELEDFDRAVAYYRSVDDPLTAPFYRDRSIATTRSVSTPEHKSNNLNEAVRLVLSTVGELIEIRKARVGFAINRRLDQQARAGIDPEPALAVHLAAASALVASVEKSAGQVGYDWAAALAWIRSNLGVIAEAAAARVARGIVAIDSGAVSGGGTRRLREALGDNLLPALTWLLAGAVATAGDGDPTWLLRGDG